MSFFSLRYLVSLEISSFSDFSKLFNNFLLYILTALNFYSKRLSYFLYFSKAMNLVLVRDLFQIGDFEYFQYFLVLVNLERVSLFFPLTSLIDWVVLVIVGVFDHKYFDFFIFYLIILIYYYF